MGVPAIWYDTYVAIHQLHWLLWASYANYVLQIWQKSQKKMANVREKKRQMSHWYNMLPMQTYVDEELLIVSKYQVLAVRVLNIWCQFQVDEPCEAFARLDRHPVPLAIVHQKVFPGVQWFFVAVGSTRKKHLVVHFLLSMNVKHRLSNTWWRRMQVIKNVFTCSAVKLGKKSSLSRCLLMMACLPEIA